MPCLPRHGQRDGMMVSLPPHLDMLSQDFGHGGLYHHKFVIYLVMAKAAVGRWLITTLMLRDRFTT